jgi:hypothetical protein
VVDTVNAALKNALKDPDFIKRQEALGAVVVTDARVNPADHKKFVEAESPSGRLPSRPPGSTPTDRVPSQPDLKAACEGGLRPFGAPLLLVDSVTEAPGHAPGQVVVSGSHAGASVVRYALAAQARLAVFNDAGIGKDEAGVAALAALQAAGVAACAWPTQRTPVEDGVLSRANALRWARCPGCGCATGSAQQQRNRHRPVVDQVHLHVGAEAAGLHHGMALARQAQHRLVQGDSPKAGGAAPLKPGRLPLRCRPPA